MSLLRKMRVLVGALVHKPFMPHPERDSLAGDPDGLQRDAAPRHGPASMQKREAADAERVADLIVQEQQRARD